MNTDHQARFDSLYEQHLRALKRHGKAVKTIEAYGLARATDAQSSPVMARRVANVRSEIWQDERSKPIAVSHGHYLLTPY